MKGYNNSGSCYDLKGGLQRSDTIEVQIYHRKQGRPPDDVKTARMQIASQELWGGPYRNYMGGSDIPKVKAYMDRLPLLNDRVTQQSGLEFTTTVEPDSYHPVFAYWSGDREGVHNEDGYAKIKVRIEFCNQFDEVYIAND